MKIEKKWQVFISFVDVYSFFFYYIPVILSALHILFGFCLFGFKNVSMHVLFSCHRLTCSGSYTIAP